MFQFPETRQTPNSFAPSDEPSSQLFEVVEPDPIGIAREEYLMVLTSLAAAEIPLLTSEGRNRDRHLWLGGLDSVARDILEKADIFEQELHMAAREDDGADA